MTVPAALIDPFHRALHGVLTAEIDRRMVALASGSAPTFEDYKAQSAYIQALTDVLSRCEEMENERYGARPGADNEGNK
jgi:hypothetical protein